MAIWQSQRIDFSAITKTYWFVGVLSLLTLSTVDCAQRPVLPDQADVQVSREKPKSNCQSQGMIEGRSVAKIATPEQALADLKKSAAHRGFNYVQIHEYSELGGSVRGEGFVCP